MGVRINQNIISLLIQRNLNRAVSRIEQSTARISSGERINRASDDATGLAMSQQIRYEVRGLQHNQRNISGGFSMLGTAESSLQGIGTILQRMRELAVQAANGTLNAAARGAIQDEVNQLIAEIDRTAGATNYLGLKLLDGSVNQKTIQIGTEGGQRLSVTLADFRAAKLGQVARGASAQGVSTARIAGGGDLQINGVTIPTSKSDGLSTANPSASALAKVRAINEIEHQTGVHAEVEPVARVDTGAAIGNVFLNGTTERLTINGVSITPVNVTADDADNALLDAINAQTKLTGVEASIDPSGALSLVSVDGRNFTLDTNAGVALGLSAATDSLTETVTSGVALVANDPFTVTGDLTLIGFATGQVELDPATSIGNFDVTSVDGASQAIAIADAALRQLNDARASIGALQNRLEGIGDSIARRIEELSASDSRIRDTDFAFETARLAQSQILQEAAIALLAQANVAPRTALQLLRR